MRSGTAYIGTFDKPDARGRNDYFEPAWIFSHRTGPDAEVLAETVSHEVGHNLGLEA